MTVYVAKCHYYKQEFNEAAIKIRDAMVEFGNFNMDFFDINKGENKILNKVDPRIMILMKLKTNIAIKSMNFMMLMKLKSLTNVTMKKK